VAASDSVLEEASRIKCSYLRQLVAIEWYNIYS
jgi:hypothetical protein